ncbi:MAG: hypothetical protein F6K19_17240 [Cyanothece sp. SIO1E1]|nr:hypothetical protein [Cyanothece sp. SIO1E1]
MPTLTHTHPSHYSLESLVRNALTCGELLPGAAAQVEEKLKSGNLSATDHKLISLLEDAIATGCIRRIEI